MAAMKENAQKPSQYIKSFGIKSMKQLCDMSGVNRYTLINWHKHKPDLLKMVCLGALVMMEMEKPR